MKMHLSTDFIKVIRCRAHTVMLMCIYSITWGFVFRKTSGFPFLRGGSWIFFRVTLKAFISIRMTLGTI